MAITLIKRGTDPDPSMVLGAGQHDENMTRIETAVGALEASNGTTISAVSALTARVNTAETVAGNAAGAIGDMQVYIDNRVTERVPMTDPRLTDARPIKDGSYGAFTVSGGTATLAAEGLAQTVLGAMTDSANAEAMAGVVLAAFETLTEEQAQDILMALMSHVMGPGQGIRRTDVAIEGVDKFVGFTIEADVAATEGDIIAGVRGDVVVTPSAFGFDNLRTIPYQPVLTMDFTGPTPVWGSNNRVIDVTGALELRAAATFPEGQDGDEFTVEIVRAAGGGTGNVTIPTTSPDGSAAVVYRGGLSAADIPPLGTAAGSTVIIVGKVTGPGSWRVQDLGWA